MAQLYPSQIIQALKAAFETMSSERGWYRELGITKTGAGSIMNRYKKGNLSIEKMAELLEAKGVMVSIPVAAGIREVSYLVPIEDIDHEDVEPKQLKS